MKELVESSIDCQYCESLGKSEYWLCKILLIFDLLALVEILDERYPEIKESQANHNQDLDTTGSDGGTSTYTTLRARNDSTNCEAGGSTE